MPSKIIYLNYFDAINDGKVKTLMAICADVLANHKPDILYFLFASAGGGVNAGIVFYNFLRALPAKIVMHNMGIIDSIATIIFLAGEERYAVSHSSFLFHGVEMPFAQGASLSYSKLVENSSQLKQDENKIANIYQERSKLTRAEIQDLFRQGESKEPLFAQEKGIIQEIKAAIVPKEAILISVNLS